MMRPTAPLLAALCATGILLHAATADAAQPPPNLVAATPTITTAGQPSAAWLETLKAGGYEAVVYLAPATVHDAVADEWRIVSRQGLLFVNLPVDFGRPTAAHVAQFARLMDALAGRRVLVHCQVNMRASALVFLYRATVLKEPPDAAYDALRKVWKPTGPWAELVNERLKAAGIAFEPY